MAHHAYIDESGTMDHQGVMTVAMVIFEGAHSAQKLHTQILTALIPNYVQVINKYRKGRRSVGAMPGLHFSDMDDHHKRLVTTVLSDAKLTSYTASYIHQPEPKTHEVRFAIYTALVKTTIRSALEHHQNLFIGVAKQGGWQNYEHDFFSRLRDVPEEFARKRSHRKVEFR